MQKYFKRANIYLVGKQVMPEEEVKRFLENEADEITREVQRLTVMAHNALGCRGVSRSDFRYDPARGESGLFILEINTQPGMTPLSLVPEQAAHCGMEFADLLVELVEAARCDF